MKRHDKAPNGHFAEGLILYGNLETGAMASQGFLLEPPDLQHASIGVQNDYQDKLRIFLSTLGPKQRAQLQWTCNSDYQKELIRYHQQTATVTDGYHAGDRFFSVRALVDPATADLNVIINRKVYVLELVTDKEPFQSVTFYPADEPPAQSAGQPNVGPSRLLGLLDKAKAYPLLAEQYPEMVSQIDKAEPFTQTLYEGFHVVLTKVFRFDTEDALIFQVEFVNETDKPIYYIPQSLAVRVGSGVYWSALSDASGIITAGVKDPKTGKITPGHSDGYFVICGTPHGGRNHLSVQNTFNVLVFRQENS